MGGGDIGGAGAATFGRDNSQPLLRDSGACLGVVSCCPLDDGDRTCGRSSPSRQDATEEFWYAQRRCQRCRKTYTEADNRDPSNECTFHSGQFEEPGSRKIATVMGWSCCKSVTPNPRDMEVNLRAAYYNIRGCKVAPKHKEDEHFSRLLASFPYDPNASREAHIARVLEAQALAKEKTPKQPEVPSREDCIAHTITSRDTLQGLALFYDTTIAAIRQVNFMTNDDISSFHHLLIPTQSTVTRQPLKEPVSKSKLVSRFLSAIAGVCPHPSLHDCGSALPD